MSLGEIFHSPRPILSSEYFFLLEDDYNHSTDSCDHTNYDQSNNCAVYALLDLESVFGYVAHRVGNGCFVKSGLGNLIAESVLDSLVVPWMR